VGSGGRDRKASGDHRYLEKGWGERTGGDGYVGHARSVGLDSDFYQKVDVHVHFPEFFERAGPSEGVTMATSLDERAS